MAYTNTDRIDLKDGDIALVISDELAVYLKGHHDDDPPTNGLMFITGVFDRMKNDKAFVQEQIDWAHDRIMGRMDDSTE